LPLLYFDDVGVAAAEAPPRGGRPPRPRPRPRPLGDPNVDDDGVTVTPVAPETSALVGDNNGRPPRPRPPPRAPRPLRLPRLDVDDGDVILVGVLVVVVS
jgi:hypothetical protein